MAETKKKNNKNGQEISGEILDKILASDSSADFDGEALYNSYKQLYDRQADSAAEDVFGLAANKTGGYGNSYGATSAAKVYSEFADKLADKKSEIEQTAHDRQQEQKEDLYKQYELTSDYEDRAEDREKQSLSFALEAAGQGDYSYLEKLGIDTSGAVKKEALSFAVTAAQNGDYSYLEALGVDTSAVKAEKMAKYGDYSGLSALGVDVSKLTEKQKLEIAEIYAEYGDYSLLKLLGVDTTGKEKSDKEQSKLLRARYSSLINK